MISDLINRLNSFGKHIQRHKGKETSSTDWISRHYTVDYSVLSENEEKSAG